MPSYPRRLRYAAIAAAVATSSVLAFAGTTVSASTASQAPSACANATIENGSFENPVIPANSFRQPNESTVPGWETTATDGLIEI